MNPDTRDLAHTLRQLVAGALTLGACLGSLNAQAQATYPTKPVRFIVSFGPGGPADIIARMVGQKLTESMGQPVVIENRVGAGGAIAAAAVHKMPADGYALLITTTAFAVAPAMGKNPGYDAEKDYILASVVASSPNVLVAGPALKARTLQELVAQAKSGKLNYATAGAGTTPHLTAEYLFKVLAKVDVTHIPFQSGAQAVTATIGGQTEVASAALPGAVEMLKAGKIRGLAVTSRKRFFAIPDVPTVAESGFPGFEDYTWVGVLAPAGTPADVIARLNSEINKLLATPDMQSRLAVVGFEPVGGSVSEASSYLKTELARWAKVVKETGVRAE